MRRPASSSGSWWGLHKASSRQWAFNTLTLNRVQSEADTRNAAAGRVLEKLGFLREGTLRENCMGDGEVSASWVYGLLRREWEQLQSHLANG